MRVLPRPHARPGDAADQARAIARFAADLESDVEQWHPHAPNEIWAGTAADRQRAAVEVAVTGARSIVEELRRVLTPLMALEQALDDALAELARLQREVDDAWAAAESSVLIATRDLREAEAWAHGGDPALSAPALEATARAARSSAAAARAADDARQTETRCAARAQAICAEFEATDLATALRLDATLGGDPVALRSHLTAAPPQIAREALADLRPQIASTLTSLAPDALASLPTAPLGMRYAANRIRVRDHVDWLREQRAAIVSVPPARRLGSEQRRLDWLDRQLAVHRPFLAPGRQLLEWDPGGDGQIVEVLGDAATASHIAIVVPGITNTITNFDRRLRQRSSNIFEAATELDPETAVIAWLGYDTPGLIGSVSKSRAIDASRTLTDFVDALPAERHITLVAHSYGTVVAGLSARTRLAVDELILVGSPGTPLDHARQARLEPGARVWSATSNSDLVGRVGPGTDRCPEALFGGRPLSPSSVLWPACRLDSDGDVYGLVHGRNPSHAGFGATEIPTSGVSGHSEYFDRATTSLEAIARIVVGDPLTEG